MEFLFQLRGGILKAVFKGVVIGMASLLGLGVIAVLAILLFPQLLVNDRALIIASHLADRAGVHVSWDQGHVAVESPKFLEKRIHLDFTGLCVRMPSVGLDACFDRARIAAAGGLKRFRPLVTEIGPVDLRGGKVAYTVLAEEKPTHAKESAPPAQAPKKGKLIPAYLARARLLPLHVEIPDWRVTRGATRWAGDFGLDSHSGPKGQAQVAVRAHAATKPANQRLAADLELENPQGFLTLDGWKLVVNAEGMLADGTQAQVRAKLDPRPGAGALDYAYDVQASYQKLPARASLEAKGEASPDRLVAKLSATGTRLWPQLEQAWINDCELRLERQSSETRPGALRLNCPIEAKIPAPPEGFRTLSLPSCAAVRVTADLKSGAFPPSADSVIEGKVGVALEPVMTPIFQGEGKVESELAGVPQEFPNGWKMDTDLGLQLRISSFERLVRSLTNTSLDIWAPLRPLKGEVELAVQGKFDANSGSAPVRLRTRLASETQTLNLDAEGTASLLRLQPSPRVHLSMGLALNDVRLELPPLPKLPSPADPKVEPLPQLFPDSRISRAAVAKQQAATQEPGFTYDLKIYTPDESHPVRLVTPQIKAPIPLTMNLAIVSGAPPKGQVKVLGFPAKLFKRDVQMDHVTVTLEAPTKDSKLDGRIVIPYTDYTISILVLGTTDKPQVRFLSEPPLPEDQIIAVLIFGKPVDALDPDQQRSVGDSRAALSRGVLSLASLYYLSALNIDSIDYDPVTHTASISYRLAEGTSLTMSQGAGGGQPSVGIRKRLNKHFAITTTLNNPSAQQTNRSVSTYLEWAYQY